MKTTFRLSAILLAVCLLAALLPVAGAVEAFAAPVEKPCTLPQVAQNDTGRAEIDAATEMMGGDLSEIRAYLLEQFAACAREIDLTAFNIPADSYEDYSPFFEMMYYALPEAFHIKPSEGSLSVRRDPVTGKKILAKITMGYYLTADEYADALARVRAAADELLAGIRGNDALSDLQKALLIHDRLALWVAYTDVDEPVGPFASENEYLLAKSAAHHERATVYSALACHVAVCQGYAIAYGYLLDQVGIENYYVNSDQMNHSWNLVYIDGVAYFADVTWDDPYPDNPCRVLHGNFLGSTEGFRALEHWGTDFETVPQDTRYDGAFWSCAEGAFQLLGDEIYYVDNTAGAVCAWDGTVIKEIDAEWSAGGGSYWVGNYARLTVAGTDLLYSTDKAVYVLDPATGETRLVYTLDEALPEEDCIYGLAYEAPDLLIYTNTKPGTHGVEPIRVPYGTACTHEWGEASYTWADDNGACTAARTCSVCGAVESETVNSVLESNFYVADFENEAFETREVLAFLWGDVNDDGVINNKDVVRLKNYIANYDEEQGCAPGVVLGLGADTNGDGVVNNKDVVRLKNYIANYDEATGVSTVVLGPARS